MEECILHLEKRISDLEKRLLYHEEKEYYKYLVAGQNKKIEPIVEIKPKEMKLPILWMNFRK